MRITSQECFDQLVLLIVLPTDEYKTSDLQPARLQSPALTSITNVASEIGQGRQNRSSTVAASRSPKMNEVKATNDTEVHDSFMGQTKEWVHRFNATHLF